MNMNNWVLSTYKGRPAIYCRASKCFVAFGKKTDLVKRVHELNKAMAEKNNKLAWVNFD